jgi:hypothetical protein
MRDFDESVRASARSTLRVRRMRHRGCCIAQSVSKPNKPVKVLHLPAVNEKTFLTRSCIRKVSAVKWRSISLRCWWLQAAP